MAKIHEFGKWGEDVARWYLEKRGMTFIDSRVKVFEGEIDLIMKDVGRDEIVFVEVKTRSENYLIDPSEVVNEIKQKKIVMAADIWISRQSKELCYRFDVVVVVKNRRTVVFEHLPLAF